jgi:hypothetical protein
VIGNLSIKDEKLQDARYWMLDFYAEEGGAGYQIPDT